MDTGTLVDGQINLNSGEHPSVAIEKTSPGQESQFQTRTLREKLASLSFLERTKSRWGVTSLIIPRLLSLLGRESVVLDQTWRELEDSMSISKG